MKKKFTNPPDLPKWYQSFSQVVTVESGGTKTIYMSGQVSVDEKNNLIGPGDLGIQAEQSFRNLQRALAAGGASPSDVVKIHIYLKNYRSTDATIVREAFRRTFPQKELPASTWVGVETLALEGLLIEVDAVAVVAA